MTKTYTRRTPEQIVADLEAKIEAVKARAAAKEAKGTPEGQALIAAVRAIDKAAAVAGEAQNQELGAALESARAALAPAIVGMGLRMPEAKRRARKRRKRAAA